MGEEFLSLKSQKKDHVGERPSLYSIVKSAEESQFKQLESHSSEWQSALNAGILFFKPLYYLLAPSPIILRHWSHRLLQGGLPASIALF